MDKTQKVFDDITVSKEHHSFVYLICDQLNSNSALAEDSVFYKALAGSISGVNSNKLHGMTLFPETFFDASLLTSTATSFKQLFDQGNNSFTEPAIFEGLVNYQDDYTSWKQAIDSVQNAAPVCGIGLGKQEFGSNINIYVKIDFYSNVNDSINVALYLTENGIIAKQLISANDTSFTFAHQHVLRSSLQIGDFGEGILASAVAGNEYKTTIPIVFPSNVNKANSEYIAVVFQMNAGLPFKVLNCASLR